VISVFQAPIVSGCSCLVSLSFQANEHLLVQVRIPWGEPHDMELKNMSQENTSDMKEFLISVASVTIFVGLGYLLFIQLTEIKNDCESFDENISQVNLAKVNC
jgi:hypothetical protein